MSNGHDARRQRRRSEILSAASVLFLEHGYAQTSMDAIQRAVGGSKRTLYSHFSSKEDLLKAIVEDLATRFLEGISAELATDRAPEEALVRLGRTYLQATLAPEAVNLFRLVVSQSHIHPQLLEVFMERGLCRALAIISARLRVWSAEGALEITDPEATAMLLIGMLRGPLVMQALLLNDRDISKDVLEDHIQRAVRVFLEGVRPR
ncbi:MAG: TetR/AcrR family transcriptional regulator [Myxococcota bacterium]